MGKFVSPKGVHGPHKMVGHGTPILPTRQSQPRLVRTEPVTRASLLSVATPVPGRLKTSRLMRREGYHKRALTPMPGSERQLPLSFDMQSHLQALQPTQDKTRQDNSRVLRFPGNDW